MKAETYKPSFAEARHRLTASLSPVDAIQVSIEQAGGFFASLPVLARAGFPPQGVARKDGFAVIDNGQFWRVQTGQTLPDGTRYVVPVELWNGTPPAVEPQTSHIVEAGAELGKGDIIVPAGTRISPAHLAWMTLAQVEEVSVFRSPEVSLYLIGNGPVGPAIAGWLYGLLRQRWGATVRLHTLESLDQLDASAESFDLGILLSDGEPGRYDEIRASVLNTAGPFEPIFWKVDLHPCKHIGLVRASKRTLLVLPDLFSKTVMSSLALLPEAMRQLVQAPLVTVSAQLTEPVSLPHPFPWLVPVTLHVSQQGQLQATPLPNLAPFSAFPQAAASAVTVLHSQPKPGHLVAVRTEVLGPDPDGSPQIA